MTLHVWPYEFQAVLQYFKWLFCHFLHVFLVLMIFDNFSRQQTSKNLKILINFFVTIFRSETTLDCLILNWFLRDFQKCLEFLKYDFFYSYLALMTIEIIISVHFGFKQLKFRRFSLKILEIKMARNLNLTRVTNLFY